MSWRFDITREAEEDLRKLDVAIKERVVEKLKWFVANFEQVAPLQLKNKWRGFFKLRVGDWRVLYEIDAKNQMVVVHMIDRRDRIYKRR